MTKRGSKETWFLYSPFFVGDRKKCFRTDKLSPKGGAEAVCVYSEVKFVRSKKAQKQRKIEQNEIFQQN